MTALHFVSDHQIGAIIVRRRLVTNCHLVALVAVEKTGGRLHYQRTPCNYKNLRFSARWRSVPYTVSILRPSP